MARQKLRVIYENGRVINIKITPKVEVAIERHYKQGLQAMGKDAHAEHVYYMAWVALNMSGQEDRSFDEFMNVLEDVEPMETEEDIPFPAVTPLDSSSS